jgi:hypothetical protein
MLKIAGYWKVYFTFVGYKNYTIYFYGFYRLLEINEEDFCLFGACHYDSRLCGQSAGSR